MLENNGPKTHNYCVFKNKKTIIQIPRGVIQATMCIEILALETCQLCVLKSLVKTETVFETQG